jgi:ankyrin repeat protein
MKGSSNLACVACVTKRDQAATVAALLGAGANAEASEPTNKDTALMMAAAAGHTAAVEALLAGGADTKAKDIDGDTALDLARDRKQAAVVAILESRK